jgi:hypothetical protein
MTDINTQKLLKLPAPTLLLGVQSLGVKLSVEDGQLAYAGKPKILTAELLDLLKARKRDLLGALRSGPEPALPPIVGQDVDDFCRETWSDAESYEDPKTWRDLPVTEKQRETLRKGNCFDIPATRGAASDKIKELIDSGAFCDFLSLAELESFDHRAPGGNRNRRRFCCPHCGDNKPMDASHRCLSVDTTTGGYRCWRCDAKGKLREYCGGASQTRIFVHIPPAKEETGDYWKPWLAFARPIRDTPGADYLRRRGVPVDVAEAAGVKFGTWRQPGDHKSKLFDAVIFPIRNNTGKLIAAQARAIAGDFKNTRGPKSQGVFFTTPGRSERLAITEAPIDALVLAACGLPAIALLGTTWPAWLPGALTGRNVALAMDADEAGDDCARKLGALLYSWRFRPTAAKDWAELAEWRGLYAVRDQITAAEITLEEAVWGNAA